MHLIGFKCLRAFALLRHARVNTGRREGERPQQELATGATHLRQRSTTEDTRAARLLNVTASFSPPTHPQQCQRPIQAVSTRRIAEDPSSVATAGLHGEN